MYYIIICVAAILLISAGVGLKRGLFKAFFGLLALILSVVATYVASPYVSAFLIDNTNIDEKIESRIYDKIEDKTRKKVEESLKNAGVTKDVEALTDAETVEILSADPDKATQMQYISEMNLPESVKKVIIENNNDSIYDLLGIEGFYKYISNYVAVMIVNLLAFILTFIAVRLILFLIGLIIGRLIEDIPIVAFVNRVGGMVLGLGTGLILIWIFMIIAGFIFGAAYDEMIAENILLQKLDETNLIMRLLTNLW